MTDKPELQKLKVLLVEDEETVAETVQFRLSQMALNSTIAINRDEAYQALSHLDEYSVIISDLNMPSFNGIDFLKSIKKIDPKKEVIIVTGWTSNLIELLDNGVFAIIEKPFTRSDFDPVIRNALNTQDRFAPPAIPQHQSVLKREIGHSDPLENQGTFQMGRLGFFIHCDTTLRDQEILRFEISFPQGPLVSLNGVGQVLWIRKDASKETLPGLGIRIISLDPSTLKPVLEWISLSNVVAAIPKGLRYANIGTSR